MSITIGFTGTQKGMTSAQRTSVSKILSTFQRISEASHGDCIGADEEFHQLCLGKIPLVIHPPLNEWKRAFCKGGKKRKKSKPYLERNHNIVDASTVLIATPKEIKEQLRSGTWATIRYARKRGKQIFIVFPNGKWIVE